MEESEDKGAHSDADHPGMTDIVDFKNKDDKVEADTSAQAFDLLDLGGVSVPPSELQVESTIDLTVAGLLADVKPLSRLPDGDPFDLAVSHSIDALTELRSSLADEPVEHDLLENEEPVQPHKVEKTDLINMQLPENTDQSVNDKHRIGVYTVENKDLSVPPTNDSPIQINGENEKELKLLLAERQSIVALHETVEEMNAERPLPLGIAVADGEQTEINGDGDEDGRATKEHTPVVSTVQTENTDDRVEQPESDLSTTQAMVSSQQVEFVVQELQSKLEEQMGLKAEAENQARLATKEISDLKILYINMAKQIQDFQKIKSNVEKQMSAKAEAENEARNAKKRVDLLEAERNELQERLTKLESSREQESSAANEAENTIKFAFDRLEQLEKEMIDRDGRIQALEEQLKQACQEVDSQRLEAHKLREERDELLRKEVSLTSRLNAAKMKESDKSNLAEQYESEIKAVEDDLKSTKSSLYEMTAQKEKLELEMNTLKSTSDERVIHAEHALAEERRLNEERKRKMKVFVENKAEELRQAKEENDALQLEVNQANSSLLELNNRWKQVQAQYVQSQSRNRELQMDLNRIKKDSENLHRVGDTLEMKLSKSATETEEHKNKRLAAKHELMTVLRSLENEKKLTARLRDTIKFTFTPKALSQQKLLQENLDDFEAQLQKLAQRLGKAFPPSTASGLDTSETDSVNANDTTSDNDIERLIAKLERETQVVSQCIMELSGNLERMHAVLDSNADRTCVSVIAELLMTGGNGSSAAAIQPGTTTVGGQARLGNHRHRYGSVPSSTLHS